ncbi:hypothetical protein [Flavitalea sp.]|nr:hypothetical protein [Flavitalea sp.]
MHDLAFNPMVYKMDIVEMTEKLESEKVNVALQQENKLLTVIIISSLILVCVYILYEQSENDNKEKHW